MLQCSSREDSNLTCATRQEKVGSTLGLAVSSRNPLNTRSDPACSTLPEYLAKSLGQMEGFKQYTKSQCLDGVLNTLVRHLDVPKDQTTKFGVSRVTGCPCPVHLAKDPPQIHVHGSNGVFVVSQGDDVYLACSYCQLSAPPSKHVELVRGTESTRFNWFKYTEASWEKMMKDTKAVWLMKGRGTLHASQGRIPPAGRVMSVARSVFGVRRGVVSWMRVRGAGSPLCLRCISIVSGVSRHANPLYVAGQSGSASGCKRRKT